jgi:hypothetical protein
LSCHRHRIALSILLCCLALPHTAARGGVQNTIRTATPVSAGSVIIIQRDIDTQKKLIVTNIAGGDATKVRQARQTLIDNADNANGSASDAYQKQYATQLDESLSPLTAAPNPRLVRLNAAIVIGQVAEKVSRTDNADIFAKVAAALLQTKDFETQLWGLKIAKFVLSSEADKNAKIVGDLDKLIVKTVENSKFPGELIEEAYRALKFDPLAQPPAMILQNNRKLAVTLATLTLPDLLDLIEWRTQQFKNGPPVNPRAESELTGYLPVGAGLEAVNSNPELRDRTLKAVGELTCAQLKAATDAIAAGIPLDPDLIDVARNCGSAMASFGGSLANGNPPVNGAEALAAAGDVIRREIQLNTSDDKLKSWCDGLTKALQGMNIQVSMP